MSFVRSKRAAALAEKIALIQKNRMKLQRQVQRLCEEEQYYTTVLRQQYGDGFRYESKGYEKEIKFLTTVRTVLDQRKAKILLGKKTPYRDVKVHKTVVDYVYQYVYEK